MMKMNSVSIPLYATVSFLLAGPILLSSARQDPASWAEHLLKDCLNVIILSNTILLSIVVFSKMLQRLLFGSLHPSELTRIMSEIWSTGAESVLLLTVFRREMNLPFAILFFVVQFLKPYHWIHQERSDRISQNPSRLSQLRYALAGFILLLADATVVYISHTRHFSPILFITEAGILLLSVLQSLTVHVLACASSSAGWPVASQYLIPQLTNQLVFDFARLVLHIPFLFISVRDYALPVHTIKDIYLESKSLSVAWTGIARARDASLWLRNLGTDSPLSCDEQGQDITMKGDDTCLVCREDLIDASVFPVNQELQTRVLPCQHAFHLGCLRVWIERQQNCPTCRAKIRPNVHRKNSQRTRYHNLRLETKATGVESPLSSPSSSPTTASAPIAS